MSYIGFFYFMSKLKDKKLVELGSCFRPHGIKGGFQFKLFNPGDSVLSKGHMIYLFPADKRSSIAEDGEKIAIASIHFGNKTICYLKDIKDRNLVEAMIPFKIFLPREEFPELEDGEVYIHDVIGLTVVDIDGYEIGKVTGHFDNGAQIVLKIKLKTESIELPFVDAFFPHVNLKDKKITLILPEYE